MGDFFRKSYPWFNLSAGRSTTDSVWRRAARAELGVRDNKVSGCVFWDLSSFYEMVQLNKLHGECKAVEYPMSILNVCLQSYRWVRVLSLESIVATGIFPIDGVLAGSFSATYEVKAYVAQAVKRVTSKHLMVRISVHVDDFAQEATADTEEKLAQVLVESSVDLKFELEEGLDQSVAPSKCNAVTLSLKATKMLNNALGNFGTAASAVKDLGVDYGAGKCFLKKKASKSKQGDSRLELSGTTDSSG